MSLVLYNPLEAGILLGGSWLIQRNVLRNTKFELKTFVLKSYIVGTLNFIIQYPERYFQDTIYYALYLIVVNYITMGLILKVFGYKNNLLEISLIILFFDLSLTITIE